MSVARPAMALLLHPHFAGYGGCIARVPVQTSSQTDPGVRPPSDTCKGAPTEATYILPVRRDQPEISDELVSYIHWLSLQLEVIVVDGSPTDILASHAETWAGIAVHVPPDADLRTPNGKVGGVLTGVRRASHERLVIADDDVRYDQEALERVINLLDEVHVVRPQNYFHPLPWHARWDTARTLLNRATGADWPGTLGVRRSVLCATGGYDGSVLFENLELVRTVLAAGGTEAVPLDLYVRRSPPTARHFWSQRVRQAYDELARPLRFSISLAILPLSLILASRRRWGLLAAGSAAVVGVAEIGRWRGGGREVFPRTSSLLAPAWIAERAVCAWLALWVRVTKGGVQYRGTILRRAATRMTELRQRLKSKQSGLY